MQKPLAVYGKGLFLNQTPYLFLFYGLSFY